ETAEALPHWPRARKELEVALSYQMLRASLAVTNATAAQEAMRNILALKPHGEVADRSRLLMAQGLVEFGKPELARGECESFLALAPDSPLRPEVEVLLGRICEEQAEWPAAIAGYESWLARFPTNALRSRVEFQRAWANYKAGR